MENQFFQNHMQDNICFGCGIENKDGLQIKSFWQGEESICHWTAEEKHQGWKNLLNGGVIATLIDCHCMGTAMAAAYKAEHRPLDSQPFYRYATGTLNVRYIKPTPNDAQITLKAKVIEIKNKKTVLECGFYANDILTAKAEVVALRVFDSSEDNTGNPFA